MPEEVKETNPVVIPLGGVELEMIYVIPWLMAEEGERFCTSVDPIQVVPKDILPRKCLCMIKRQVGLIAAV